jgi:transcriptional regulator with XRE-family HTH domain
MSIGTANPLKDRESDPNSIDKSLGLRLRAKRMSSGLSQEELAEKLQIHPDDVSAYEKGEKRISAVRLLHMSEALGVRPTYFFGFSDERRRGVAEDGGRPWAGLGVYLTLPDQGVRLNRAFIAVKNAALREAIVTLVAELAKSEKAG